MEKFQEKPSIFQIILAIIGGVFSFFLFTKTTNPVYIIAIGAIVIAGINGALNGAILGGLTSLLGTGAGIWYHLNKLAPKIKPNEAEDQIAKKIAALDKSKAFIDGNKIFILIGIIAIAIIGRILYVKLRESEENKEHSLAESRFNTRKMVYASVFVALSVAINSLRIGSISFGGFPIIFGGFALGPVMGFIIGAVSDLLGFLIRPSSQGFNPLFVLTSALTGAIPVMVLSLIPIKNKLSNFVAILVSIAVGQIITSVIMVPVFRYFLYGNPILVTMTKAFIKQLYSVPLYTLLFINTQKVVLRDINSNLIKRKHRKPSKEAV